MSSPRAIMFDLDGTLVDTMFAFADLAAELMAARHGDDPAVARARYLATSGVPFAQQLEIIHPGHPANVATSSEFEIRKRAITRNAVMDQRARDALTEMRSLGLQVVLSSNTGQEFVDEFTRREPFRFDLALGFDADAGMAKGRPHVARTVATLGVTTDRIWFVGDSLKDRELAEGCGLTFFGRLGTFAAADFERAAPGTPTVGHIAELLEPLVLALVPPRVARTAAG